MAEAIREEVVAAMLSPYTRDDWMVIV